MVNPLREYFGTVYGSDLFDYGAGFDNVDFLSKDAHALSGKFDWIITNPPFARAEAFTNQALRLAKHGVAMFARTAFLEGTGRHKRLFSQYPPFTIAQFSERVPIFAGRLDPNGSTAASYCWVIWLKEHRGSTNFHWIPRLRKTLEKSTDYQEENGDESPKF